MARIILHVDMNAFFATVEKILDPSLQDKPIVVGHDSSRGVVSTACYIARKYGIHSAMPIYKAKQLCPNITIVNSHFDKYEEFRDKFLNILFEYSNKIEVASIDECYVDISEYFLINKHLNPFETIKNIQKRIYNETKLLCSIGISINKFLAKMASDLKKPMGITVIRKKDISNILWPIKIDDMYGIGKKTAPRLKEIGINTIGDLANYDPSSKLLYNILGKNTERFIKLANGIDNSRIIVEDVNNKSIGHSVTLLNNTDDIDVLIDTIKDLTKKVSFRAIEQNLLGNNIGITLKYSDFTTCNRSIKIKKYTNNYNDIIEVGIKLLESNYEGEMVRLVGISLNNLLESGNINYQPQIELNKYNINNSNNFNKTDDIIAQINNKYNKKIVKKGNE